MKRLLLTGIIIFTIASCGENNNSTTVTPDSTSITPGASAEDTATNSRGVTGTTGTGTVSDSGNAANAAAGSRQDSVDTSKRSTSLNGKDTVSR